LADLSMPALAGRLWRKGATAAAAAPVWTTWRRPRSMDCKNGRLQNKHRESEHFNIFEKHENYANKTKNDSKFEAQNTIEGA
jgi:hypothetical protein